MMITGNNLYTNYHLINKNNRSGYTGVHWNKNHKKWISKIVFNQKTIHLGSFENIHDAIEKREKAEIAFSILKALGIRI